MQQRGRFFLLIISFLGGVYCLFKALGSDLFCGTRGCEIYADYGLFGVSFYVYGAVGFLAIFMFTILRNRPTARVLLAVTLGLALLFDTLFLIYQTLLWPCSSCQVVALLIGLSAFLGVTCLHIPGRKLLLGVGVIWSVFFIYVSVAVVKELVFSPWPIYGSVESPIKVIFSPTCPACEDVVRKVLDDPRAATKTAFYPVAKNSKDEARLARIFRQTNDAVDTAGILGLFQEEPPGLTQINIKEKFQLLSNKMVLAKTDATTVPLIISPTFLEICNSNDKVLLPINYFLESSQDPASESGCSAFSNSDDCDD